MNFIIASGPVIIENNKVLLTKDRKDDFWKFPGGTVEPGENEITTCHREAKEEIGVDLKIIKKLTTIKVNKPQGQNVRIELNHYLAKRVGEIQPGNDIIDWQWHDINNLPDNCAPNIKPVIDEYLKQKT